MSETLTPMEAKIIKYMEEHGSITALEAATKLRCLSLPQRIYDLRWRGYKIKATYRTSKNNVTFCEYSLVKKRGKR